MNMRTFTIALFAMIVWTGCAGDGDGKIMGKRKADQKYGMESGIITYEAALPQNMGSNKRVLYFDDYGKMEKVVTTTSISAMGQSMETVNHSLIKDGYVYAWSDDAVNGSKYKVNERFDPSMANYSQLSDEMKAKYNLAEEADESFMDKNCKVYTMDFQGVSGKVWVWENLPLKIQASAMGMIMTEKVVNMQEDVAIPSGTFDLPALEWQEIAIEESDTSN
jgi:hypothetical protein